MESLSDIYKKEIQRIGDAIGLSGKFMIDWGTDNIIDAYKIIHDELYPPPKMEPAETIQYVVIEPSDGHVVVMTDSKSQAKGLVHGQRQLVEVRIPYQREIKTVTRVYGGFINANRVLCVNDPCAEIPMGKPLTLTIEWKE